MTRTVPHRTIPELESEILRLKTKRAELTARISRLGRAIRYQLQHRRPGDQARFWSYVDRSEHPRGCWIWTGLARPTPSIWWKGRVRSARAIAWELDGHRAALRPGQRLEVRCGLRMCVRPAHLVPGRVRVAFPGDLKRERVA